MLDEAVVRLEADRAQACEAQGVGEHVGHLERAADGLGALLDTRLGLLDVIEREKSEGDGNAGLERGELQPACRLARDVVEVRRVSSDDAAEGDDAGEAPGLRKGGGGNGQLEGARDHHDRDRIAADSGNARAPRAHGRGDAM